MLLFPGVDVLRLKEQPLILPGMNDMPLSSNLLTMENQLQFTGFDFGSNQFSPGKLEAPLVPDPDRPPTVLSPWDDTLEIEVHIRMILGLDSEMFVLWVIRESLWNRPATERRSVEYP